MNSDEVCVDCGGSVARCPGCGRRVFHVLVDDGEGVLEITACVACDYLLQWPRVQAVPGAVERIKRALSPHGHTIRPIPSHGDHEHWPMGPRS